MKNTIRHSGRRFEILSLLDGVHEPPKESEGWSSSVIAKICRISPYTVHHLLRRLHHYGLVDEKRSGEVISIERRLKDGGILKGGIQKRTLLWKTTPRGRGRVDYVGGHDRWCPLCKTKL